VEVDFSLNKIQNTKYRIEADIPKKKANVVGKFPRYSHTETMKIENEHFIG
jgi:hypothetical protein